jgi:hypothetical protein
MSIENTTLLGTISEEASDSSFSFGDKQRGAGYHKNNDGIHTAVYQFDDFIGTVKIQGTLELYPGDDDWFDINGTELGGDSTKFADDAYSRTFTGKFIWIRAAYNIQNGTIVEIRYNY